MVFGSNTVQLVPRYATTGRESARSTKKWFSPHDLGSNVYSYNPGEMLFTVTGAFTIGGVNSGIFNTDSYQVSDDLTLVRGNHQLGVRRQRRVLEDGLPDQRAVGRRLERQRADARVWAGGFPARTRGAASSTAAGNALPMDMWYSGRLRAGHVEGQFAGDGQRRPPLGAVPRPERRERRHLQLGHRQLPEQREERRSSSTRRPASCIPATTASPAARPDSKKQWLNFSPRVGLAWDVHGDGRTAVRTSYGIGYDFPTGERHNINAQAPPWGNRSLLQNPPGGLRRPVQPRRRRSASDRRRARIRSSSRRRVRRDRPGHQFAARPVVERHARAAARHRSGA